VKIDKLIPESMRKNNQIKLEFKEILKKLIKYIEFGIVNKAKKENLIYTLEILEEILCQAEDLEEMQNLFDQHQATKMILNLIADYKSYPFDDDFFH
jgi:inositol 1,4,5-triphosphate receptor type 1/inositol 1,4,5-triphosphate receptor type 3